MLTRSGTGLVRESSGAAGRHVSQSGSKGKHSHRQPQRNDTSELIVTSARIVSIYPIVMLTTEKRESVV